MTHGSPERAPTSDRYALIAPIAAGGMATIHLGRMLGSGGFSRHVAIKRLHAHFATDPDFVAMLLDEGRMAARIAHPNVVATLDVVCTPDDLFLVMEYVEGVPLSFLLHRCRELGERVPVEIAVAIMLGVLQGLHAAHEARDEAGVALELVHRDVSPQNILVASDGVPRVVDFGIAKAAGRTQHTRDGQIKGKLPYMSPEQLRAGAIDRRADVWSVAAVFWEMIVGERLFTGEGSQVMGDVLYGKVPAPGARVPSLPQAIDEVVLRALERFPEGRYASARAMAVELERAMRPAGAFEVGAWVERLARTELEKRANLVRELDAREPERILETQTDALATRTDAVLTRTDAVLTRTDAVLTRTDAVLTRPDAPHAVRRLRTVSWALAALASFLFVGLVLSFGTRGRALAEAPVATPSIDPATAATTAPRRTDPAPPASLAAPASPASVAATASAAPAAPTAHAARKAKAPARAPAATSKPPAGRDPRCYLLDEAGIWHIRPECL